MDYHSLGHTNYYFLNSRYTASLDSTVGVIATSVGPTISEPTSVIFNGRYYGFQQPKDVSKTLLQGNLALD